jgi:hypothetical protein
MKIVSSGMQIVLSWWHNLIWAVGYLCAEWLVWVSLYS